ncbi:protein spaetzle-like [Lasioglossum baleicum]|uniref:protein spaetzle-like n=1 Tax=Lasioglossum baleicum TaxID=434251 RepID=UPI003FCE942F
MRALKVSILFWILNNVHCQIQWYEQSHQSYLNYKNLDKEPSVSGNGDSDVRISPRIGLKWPFSPQNRIKGTPQPPTNNKRDENNAVPNDKFLFPDNKSEKQKVASVPVCKGTTYCEDDSNYPMESVSKAIAKQNLPRYENVDEIDVTFRWHDSESLCVSNEKVIFPKTAETVDNQWLRVVNHPNYTQGVRVETCSNAGGECKLIQGFAAGYATSCEQKYIYRQLASFNDGRIKQELFRFPANCCCQIKFLGTSQRMRTDRSFSHQNTDNDIIII